MPAARALRVFVLSLLVAVLAVACADSSATNPPATSAAPTTEPAVPATPVTGSEAPTDEPPSAEPTQEPPVSEAPSASLEPEPTSDDGGAASGECTGTAENLEFYSEFADVVDWPVYCPALPAGWFVGTGQWRQAGGARLEISYRGPGGAGLLLQQGAYCPGGGDCVPLGDELGQTAFADREGTLIQTADGWAIVVDRGDNPSWLLTITGVGEADARRIAANLVEVGG